MQGLRCFTVYLLVCCDYPTASQFQPGLEARGGFAIRKKYTAKIAKGNWRIYEVPTKENDMERRGVQALWYIVRFSIGD